MFESPHPDVVVVIRATCSFENSTVDLWSVAQRQSTRLLPGRALVRSQPGQLCLVSSAEEQVPYKHLAGGSNPSQGTHASVAEWFSSALLLLRRWFDSSRGYQADVAQWEGSGFQTRDDEVRSLASVLVQTHFIANAHGGAMW